jgi:hypothetical protein
MKFTVSMLSVLLMASVFMGSIVTSEVANAKNHKVAKTHHKHKKAHKKS